jgi:hypothetical protein
MNAEVLRTLATPSFFQWSYDGYRTRTLKTGPFFRRQLGSIPCTLDCRPAPASYPEFLVSFFVLRPHADLRMPWNANLSSVLNCIVDTLLLADGLSVDDKTRRGVLDKLVREILEMKEWKSQPGCSAQLIYPGSPSTFAEQTESLAFNMLLTNVLLSRRTTFQGLEDVPGLSICRNDMLSTLSKRKSLVLGTLLEVCVKSGQVELVTALLDTPGVDVNDESLRVLEVAIQSDNLETLRLLFSTYQLDRDMRGQYRIDSAMRQAIDNDRTDAALYLIHECSLWDLTDDANLNGWFGFAAIRNDFAFVKALQNDFESEGPILEQLRHSTVGWGLSAETWCDFLYVAVTSATPRHNELVKALFTNPTLLPKFNVSSGTLFQSPGNYTELFRHACGNGNAFLVRKIAEGGADLDHLEGYEDTPPVLVALLAGQLVVVKVLIELGAKPIDPKDTKFKEGFEDGSYPEEWLRREVTWAGWRFWNAPVLNHVKS